MVDKYKILTISDMPLLPSGVGTQTKYLIESLIKTGRYCFRSLGGAISHKEYKPIKISEYGDDWIIFPVNGYGDEKLIRDLLDNEHFDAVWFVTDPRFYVWLFGMSDEIRDRNIPMLYWHVWDDEPVPYYNKPFYDSCDHVGCISKLTHHIVKQLCGENKCSYIPHATDAKVFCPYSEEKIKEIRAKTFNNDGRKDRFILFYNSRNARRKQTSTIIDIYKKFADKVGKENAYMLMQCDPFDPEGGNLIEVCKVLGVTPDQISFSNQKVPPEQMAAFYNIADVTINISDNEGFGLSCLESLSCGTVAVVNETGGLQDQIRDENGIIYGAAIKPQARVLNGSQQIPYIYADHVRQEDVVDALVCLYNLPENERIELGKKARDWTLRAFSMENMVNSWDKVFVKYIEDYKKNGYPERIKFKKI